MKRFFAVVIALFLILSLISCERTKKNAETEKADTSAPEKTESNIDPLFWEVTDENGNKMYLFGTVHVADDGVYPLPEKIENAFENSDALAVEFDVVAYQKDLSAQMKDMALLVYADGSQVKDHLPEELYDECVKILKDEKQYSSVYNSYIPAIWASLIDGITMEKLGMDSSLGLDIHFINEANDAGKEIIDVESSELQYRLLAGFSEPLQEMMLQESIEELENIEDTEKEFEKLIDAWKTGDPITLEKLLTTEDTGEFDEDELEIYEEYTSKMLTDRNVGMADFCEETLKSGKTVFMCVGCAHFLGEDGVVSLLTERGYSVERK